MSRPQPLRATRRVTSLCLSLVALAACSRQEPTKEAAAARPSVAAPRPTPPPVEARPKSPPEPPALDLVLRDVLPVHPVSNGGVAAIAEKLRQALSAGDMAPCLALPEPTLEAFFVQGRERPVPSRGQWLAYCQALARKDPTRCHGLSSRTWPDLKQDCRAVLERVLSDGGKSAELCLEQIGRLYETADDASACLKRLGKAPRSPRLAKVEACLQRPADHASERKDHREQCLFDLAVATRDGMVCDLLPNPLPPVPFSRPACRRRLGTGSVGGSPTR